MNQPERQSVWSVYVRCDCPRCGRVTGAIEDVVEKIGDNRSPVAGIQMSAHCSVCGTKADRVMINIARHLRDLS